MRVDQPHFSPALSVTGHSDLGVIRHQSQAALETQHGAGPGLLQATSSAVGPFIRGFQSHGVPQKWMIYMGKSPIKIWMVSKGNHITGWFIMVHINH